MTIALLVLTLARVAAAQPGMTLPGSLPPPPTQPPGEELSETTALLLSLGGTAAAWSMIVVGAEMDHPGSGNAARIIAIGAVGTLFAPSFGHWYARSFTSRGFALRVAGGGAALLALAIAGVEGVTGHTDARVPEAFLIAGAGLYVGGTIDDIVTAPGAARRYNHRFQDVAVVPMIGPDSSGFVLTGRF